MRVSKARLRRTLRNRWFAPIAIIIFGAISGIIILFWPQLRPTYTSSINSCEKTATYTCYKTELTYITDHQGPANAFTLLKAAYQKLPFVQTQCHQLAHVIGRASYERYKDLGVTFAKGDHFCWGGYYHGAMEALASDKGYSYVATHVNNICASIAAKQRYSFDDYNCVHGLGHGFMEIDGDNIFKALNSCDGLTDSWDEQSCYGGVFMQNIMEAQAPADSDNHGVAYVKPDQPMYPCTVVATRYKQQCYLMQTSYALQTVGYDFSKGFNICTGVDAAYVDSCYQSLGRDASGSTNSSIEPTRQNCYYGTGFEEQSNCIIGAVKDFISYYHAITQAKQFCASLTPDLQPTCTSTANDYYRSQ